MLRQTLRGHRSAWLPLLSACSFVEFDTSIIYHLSVYCFGSFLLYDLFLSLQVFAFKEQNITLTVSVLLSRIMYSVTPGPTMIRAVCEYSRLILITVVIFVLQRSLLRRRLSFTSRKL